jgi:hypothetical protein
MGVFSISYGYCRYNQHKQQQYFNIIAEKNKQLKALKSTNTSENIANNNNDST